VDENTVMFTGFKRINDEEIPVFLNIRRDRMREDKCKICEANEAI